MMRTVLLYGFAGAVLGGLTSPPGAVLGGIIVGVLENLAGAYIPVVGKELKLPIALAMIITVLSREAWRSLRPANSPAGLTMSADPDTRQPKPPPPRQQRSEH